MLHRSCRCEPEPVRQRDDRRPGRGGRPALPGRTTSLTALVLGTGTWMGRAAARRMDANRRRP